MNQTTFFFFWTPESPETAQLAAHITSALSVMYVVDLLFGVNPIKTWTSGFLPIKLGATTKPAA